MKFSATILAALMGFALLASADANATESEVCRVLRAQGDPCTESDIPKLPHKSFHNDTQAVRVRVSCLLIKVSSGKSVSMGLIC